MHKLLCSIQHYHGRRQVRDNSRCIHFSRRWTPWFICLDPHPQREAKQKKDTLQSIMFNVAYPSIPLSKLLTVPNPTHMSGGVYYAHCTLRIFPFPLCYRHPLRVRRPSIHFKERPLDSPSLSLSPLLPLHLSTSTLSFTLPSTCHFALIGHLRGKEGRSTDAPLIFLLIPHANKPTTTQYIRVHTPRLLWGAYIRTVVCFSIQIFDHTIYISLRLRGVYYETQRSLQTISSILHQ